MKTRLSLSHRSGLTRRTRIVVIVCAALLPLSLIAQQARAAGRRLEVAAVRRRGHADPVHRDRAGRTRS